jgi:hypothetical protein
MRRTTTLLAAACVLAVLPACGGDDDAEPADEPAAEAEESASEPAEEPADEPAEEPASEPAEEPADEPASGGSGTATLTLDNGESYEFGILCTLEPQMAAGSEILFTAVSYDNPSLDITQFGSEGTVTDTATISVYDAETYDTLWEAGSFYEAFGGSFELSLDGSTINGSGTFYPEADPMLEPVEGTVEARCG